MSKPLDTKDLIKSIKRRAMMPTDQATFETEDYIDFLNEEINIFGVPHLLRTYEDYLVRVVDIPLVEGQKAYEIPSRAIGGKLRDAQYVDENGSVYSEISRITLEELPDYENSGTVDTNIGSDLAYILDNKLVLVNRPSLRDAFLRMYIYMKPNTLVETKRTATIQSIDKTTGTVIIDSVPNVFSNAAKYDFIGKEAPNKIKQFDVCTSTLNINTRTLVFTPSDIPSSLKEGDYVCIATETPVPQLPSELHAVLAQRVAVSCLEALGDTEGLNNAQRKLDRMELSINTIIDNRIEGAPQKIRNRHSILSELTNRRNRSNRGNR